MDPAMSVRLSRDVFFRYAPVDRDVRHVDVVVIVGGGTSAVQLLLEISAVATTTWVTRRPPVFRAGPFTAEHGRAVVAMVDARVRAGLPPRSVVHATGLALTPEVLEARRRGLLDRRPMFERIEPGAGRQHAAGGRDPVVHRVASRARPPGTVATA